jgi:MFS family permease
MSDTRWLYAWAVGSVALGGASLLVPLYVVALGGTAVDLGLLAASAAFVGAPGALVVGRIADRTGRKRPFVLGGLLLVAGGLLAVSLLDSILGVVIANAVVWFAAGAVGPVLSLLVVAGTAEKTWSDRYARLNAFQGYGWAGGLVLGVVWTGLGSALFPTLVVQRSFLFVCALAAGAGFVLGMRLLPTEVGVGRVSSPRPQAERVARAMLRARRLNVRGATFPYAFGRLYWTTVSFHPRELARRFTPTLAVYYAAVVLFFGGFAAFFAPLPIYLTQAGFTDGEIFALYLVSSLGAAVTYRYAGELAGRYDVPLLQSAGLTVRGVAIPAVTVVGGGLAAGAVALLATGVVFVVIGAMWAVIAVTATTLVSTVAPASVRGEALGVYVALSAVAGGVGSLLGGWLGGMDFTLAFGVAGVLVLVGAGVVFGVHRRTRLPASGSL